MKTIISAIGIIAAGAIFFLYTQPTYDASGVAKGQIAQYDAALTKSTELQKRKEELLDRLKTFDPVDIERLHKMLPDHVDNVRLILDLDNLAGRHGLTLQNVVVGSGATVSQPASAGSTIGTSKQGFDSLTLGFSTNATYPIFLQLLDDLQASLRIVDITSLKLAPTGTPKAGEEPTYNFDLNMRTYWLK